MEPGTSVDGSGASGFLSPAASHVGGSNMGGSTSKTISLVRSCLKKNFRRDVLLTAAETSRTTNVVSPSTPRRSVAWNTTLSTTVETWSPAEYDRSMREEFACDVCSLKINSARYHCNTCEDYDVCTRCFKRGKKVKGKGRGGKGKSNIQKLPPCGKEGHVFEKAEEDGWADGIDDVSDGSSDEDYIPPSFKQKEPAQKKKAKKQKQKKGENGGKQLETQAKTQTKTTAREEEAQLSAPKVDGSSLNATASTNVTGSGISNANSNTAAVAQAATTPSTATSEIETSAVKVEAEAATGMPAPAPEPAQTPTLAPAPVQKTSMKRKREDGDDNAIAGNDDSDKHLAKK